MKKNVIAVYLRHFRLLLVSSLLVSCGGGGGDSGDDPARPTGGTGNSLPVISMAASAVTLTENSSTTVTISATDADNDPVTLSFTAQAPLQVSYDEESQLLTIDASEVEQDAEHIIEVNANDNNGASVTRNLTVTVRNQVGERPELSWIDTELPRHRVQETTRLRLPFSVFDADNSFDELQFDVTLEGDTDALSNHSFEVDRENQNLYIDFGRLDEQELIELSGQFQVSDGNNIVSQPFVVEVESARIGLQISLEGDTLIAGETKSYEFEVRANDADDFEIVSIDYDTAQHQNNPPLDFNMNLAGRTFTVTAKPGTAGETVTVNILFKENSKTFGKQVKYIIRNPLTDSEQQMLVLADEFKKRVTLTQEYEAVALYLNEILFLRDNIGYSRYRTNKLEILGMRAGSIFLSDTIYNQIKQNVEEKPGYYDNPGNFQNVSDRMDQRINSLNQSVGQIHAFTNELLAQVGIFSEPLEKEFINNQPGSVFSRFIGNEKYGTYTDDKWVFATDFLYLDAPLRKLHQEHSL